MDKYPQIKASFGGHDHLLQVYKRSNQFAFGVPATRYDYPEPFNVNKGPVFEDVADPKTYGRGYSLRTDAMDGYFVVRIEQNSIFYDVFNLETKELVVTYE